MKTSFNKLFLFFIVLLLSIFTIGATEIDITWNWKPTVDDVSWFRFQLNGEYPDNWTVVSGDITSFTGKNLDANKSQTLYIQQSTDKLDWSKSEVSTVNLSKDEINALVESSSKKIKEVTELKEKPTKTVETKKVAEPKKEINSNALNKYYTSIKFNVGCLIDPHTTTNNIWVDQKLPSYFKDNTDYSSYFGKTAPYAPTLGLTLSFNNMANWGNYSGLSLLLGFNYELQLAGILTDWKDQIKNNKFNLGDYEAYHIFDTYYQLGFNLRFTEGFGMDTLFGGFVDFVYTYNGTTITPKSKKSIINDGSLLFGPMASLNFNIFLGKVGIISITPTYKYEWGNVHKVYAQIGLGFRF